MGPEILEAKPKGEIAPQFDIERWQNDIDEKPARRLDEARFTLSRKQQSSD